MIVSRHLEAAVTVVRQGGLLVYPTEAVFGLGCDPEQLDAVQRVLTVKQRPAHKGLILLASDLGQLDKYLLPVSAELLARIQPSWPGPVTWLLPARPQVSPLLRGEHATLAVRISAHPVCQALCTALGHPLVSTSANLAGEAAATDVADVRQSLANSIDFMLDLPLGGRSKPSEIRDAVTGHIVRTA